MLKFLRNIFSQGTKYCGGNIEIFLANILGIIYGFQLHGIFEN